MLSIVLYPAKKLTEKSEPVTVFDSALRDLAEEMNRIMIRENGVGLAAPQIGRNIRCVIVKIGDDGDKYNAYINPEITFQSPKTTAIEEGCLSVPNVYGYVKRHAKIRFTYYDVNGIKHNGKATGMEAIVLQHEIDHINGTLIINRDIELTKGHRSVHDWHPQKI